MSAPFAHAHAHGHEAACTDAGCRNAACNVAWAVLRSASAWRACLPWNCRTCHHIPMHPLHGRRCARVGAWLESLADDALKRQGGAAFAQGEGLWRETKTEMRSGTGEPKPRPACVYRMYAHHRACCCSFFLLLPPLPMRGLCSDACKSVLSVLRWLGRCHGSRGRGRGARPPRPALHCVDLGSAAASPLPSPPSPPALVATNPPGCSPCCRKLEPSARLFSSQALWFRSWTRTPPAGRAAACTAATRVRRSGSWRACGTSYEQVVPAALTTHPCCLCSPCGGMPGRQGHTRRHVRLA